MKPAFNLLNQPWIPCVTTGGENVALGILDTLTAAPRLAEIRDSSPLVTVTIHRLLLAILHRVFGPHDADVWSELWSGGNGAFDRARLEQYLLADGIHRRFDLFDDKHPFYQTASLPLGSIGKNERPKYVKPVRQLAHEIAYSDSMNLFTHYSEETDWEPVPAATVARWLVAFQAFALGGRITFAAGESSKTEGSADAGQLTKSAVVLIRDDTLFRTLVLNLIHYNTDEDEPFAFRANRDKPAWERSEETRPVDRVFDGYLDLLTWQSRRVKLIPENNTDDGVIKVGGVVTMKGYQLPGYQRFGRETMVGFIKALKPKPGEDPWPPMGFRLGRELWRDSHALLQSVSDKSERPPILKWADRLKGEERIDNNEVRLDVFGMSANQAKVYFWRHETLPLPLDYLKDAELVGALQNAIALAEDVAKAVGGAVREAVEQRFIVARKRIGQKEQKPDRNRVSAVIDSLAADRLYWSQLEEPFRRFMVTLAETALDQRDECVADWFRDTLRPAAVAAFDGSVGRLDGGRMYRAITKGRGVLNRQLAKLDKTLVPATPEEVPNAG